MAEASQDAGELGVMLDQLQQLLLGRMPRRDARPVVAECRPECFGELGHQEQLAGRQEAIAGCGWCDHGAQVEVGKVTDVDASALLLQELEAFTGTFVFTGATLMAPVDESLGSLAAVLGQWGASDRWFRRAREQSIRAGWSLHQATTELRWAAASAMRPEDASARERIGDLLDRVDTFALRSGAVTLGRMAEQVRSSLAPGDNASVALPKPRPSAVHRLRVWRCA